MEGAEFPEDSDISQAFFGWDGRKQVVMRYPVALDAARYLTDDMDAMLLTKGSCFLPSRRGQKGMPPNAEHIENLIDLVEQDGQIPIEDMNLHFTYWDTVRILCLEMIDGMSAEEAAQAYNRIQLEQLQAYERDRQAAQR